MGEFPGCAPTSARDFMANPAQFTARIPRLYDEYVEAVANQFRPNPEKAIAALDEIIRRCEHAKAEIRGTNEEPLAFGRLAG